MDNKYIKILNNYIQNLSVLEAYINGLEDILEYQSKKISPETLQDKNFVPLFKAIAVMGSNKAVEEKKELLEKYNEEIQYCEIDYEIDEEQKVSIEFNFNDFKMAKKFERLTKEMSLSFKQVEMIFSSSLISMVTYFELLAAQLIQERLLAHPEAMNIKQKSLTFSEIEEIGSLKEAKNYLIEQEVTDLMHNSFKSWIKYFETKMKVDLTSIQHDLEKVNEVFCRRHLFVHNGGVVNNIYLTRVSSEFRKGVTIGKKIPVTKEYFLDALKVFKRYGIILCLETWKKSIKTSQKRIDYIQDYIYELLIEENWELAATLCQFVLNENKITSEGKWVAQINYWLCQKNSGKLETIIKEITDADLSALSTQFKLCRYALLDDIESFFKLLQHSYPNPIGKEQLEEWPIFKEIRKSKEYIEFINSKEHTQTLVSS